MATVTRQNIFVFVLCAIIVLSFVGAGNSIAIFHSSNASQSKPGDATKDQSKPSPASGTNKRPESTQGQTSDSAVTNPAPASAPANNTSIYSQPAQVTQRNDSNALPPATVKPIVTFGIKVSPWSISRYSAGSVSVAYAVQRIGGHSAAVIPNGCTISPAIDGAYCSSSNPAATSDTGEIYVSVSNTAPDGQYTVKASFTDGQETKYGQFTFSWQAGNFTTP